MENKEFERLEKLNDEKLKEDIKATKIKSINEENLLTLFKFFIKNFAKFLGIRLVFTLLKLLKKLRKGKIEITLLFILKSIFSISNLRTTLFGSIMPTLYRGLLLLFSKLNSNKDKNLEKLVVFFTGFISCFIGISFENTTELVNFIILSIAGRVIHNIFNIIDYYPGKKVNFLFFYLSFSSLLLVNFYYPSYKPVRKLIDNYANYNDRDIEEMRLVRRALEIKF